MFYLMTHSTHFIYGYRVLDPKRKEENVLFNDAFNTYFKYSYMALDIWYRTQIAREETC